MEDGREKLCRRQLDARGRIRRGGQGMGDGVIAAKEWNAAHRHRTLVRVQAAGGRLTQRRHQGEERHAEKHPTCKEPSFWEPDHVEIVISKK
jgi:hypothetical protein